MSQSFSFLSLSLIFIVVLVLNYFHGANGDLISDVCKKASTSKPKVKYDFCAASLSEKPASKDADLLGLGEISLQTCLQNVTSIYSYLDNEVYGKGKGKHDPEPYYPWSSCSGMYGGATDFITTAITSFKSKDYKTVDLWLDAAWQLPIECDHRFKQSGLATPFAKENGDFIQLVRISLAITRMVE